MTVWTEQLTVSEILLVDIELKKHTSCYSWPTFCLPVAENRHVEQCFSTAGPRPGLGPGIIFTGPSSCKKTIYWAVISQRLRTADLEVVYKQLYPDPTSC